MTQKLSRESLEGRIALVTGGGTGIGRAIALALSARGVHVLVTGRDERAVAEVVGEIANAGAKGRHLAGDVRDREHLHAAVKKTVDTFGGLDFVIANAGQSIGVEYTFQAAAPAIEGPGRMLAIARDFDASAIVQALAAELRPREITCNAVCPDPTVEPEEVAEYVVFLCSEEGREITGQALAVGERSTDR